MLATFLGWNEFFNTICEEYDAYFIIIIDSGECQYRADFDQYFIFQLD